ncbi:MAG: CDP-diacylglycerol--serine O-phosphatidyltransferase [Alphaproteobacteria bacterium]|nr:CDP-diacylglycerol--serine O-phosphatidyltransferase [Alphaproteobacteria bacterium]
MTMEDDKVANDRVLGKRAVNKVTKTRAKTAMNAIANKTITKSASKIPGKKKWTALKGALQTMLPRAKKGKKTYLLTAMLPNLVTLLGLCAGVSSLRFALMEQWNFAVVAIIVATFLDSMDGALARMLNASSRFGAELDSLSDFATFGVSPALIMYLIAFKEFGSFGWMFVLWFVVCGALRLARFNTRSIEGTNPTWAQGFFTGTPITSSALLCLTPLMIYLAWPTQTLSLHPWIVSLWMAAVGFFMISPIPTFSIKKVEIPPKFLLPIVVGLVITATALISHPWHTISIIMILYVCTFPLSYRSYKRLEAEMDLVEKD